MDRTIEDIGAKMDALGAWETVAPYNWAVCPKGTVFPYFCTVMKGDGNPVNVRFMMIEGWQNFHDFVRTRIDVNFGFYSTPMEISHFELVFVSGGEVRLFRHDPCFMPRLANDAERALCSKILWESFGVMMRVESDAELPMKFASEKAMFARVEDGPTRRCRFPTLVRTSRASHSPKPTSRRRRTFPSPRRRRSP